MVASKTSLALLPLLYLSSYLWVQRFLTHVQAATSHLDRKIFQTGRNPLIFYQYMQNRQSTARGPEPLQGNGDATDGVFLLISCPLWVSWPQVSSIWP